MTPAELRARAEEMLAALETAIVGKRDALHLLLAAILADGHVLIEDVPGVAKTSIARAVAQILGLPFKRVQFTPDLLPADLTGGFVFDQRSATFQFRRGPVFTQLLLADEINRAAPKTQSALLEAMQERQVTVEGETFALVQPFLVIATQNPIELDGTYPLPEAQLDRFLIRLDIGYPSEQQEQEILRRRRDVRTDAVGAMGGAACATPVTAARPAWHGHLLDRGGACGDGIRHRLCHAEFDHGDSECGGTA